MNRETNHEKSTAMNWKSVIWTALIAALLTAGVTVLISKFFNAHKEHKTHQFYATRGILTSEKSYNALSSVASQKEKLEFYNDTTFNQVFENGNFYTYNTEERVPVMYFNNVKVKSGVEFYHIMEKIAFKRAKTPGNKFQNDPEQDVYNMILSLEDAAALRCTTTMHHFCIPVPPDPLKKLMEQGDSYFYPIALYKHANDTAYLAFVKIAKAGEELPIFLSKVGETCQHINVPLDVETRETVTFGRYTLPVIIYKSTDEHFWL